jgi:hypothetical protein
LNLREDPLHVELRQRCRAAPNLRSACFWFFTGAPQNRLATHVPAIRMGSAPFETGFARGEKRFVGNERFW